MWVSSGHIFGGKYAHELFIFFKAGDVIKLAILSVLLCSLNYNKKVAVTDLKSLVVRTVSANDT